MPWKSWTSGRKSERVYARNATGMGAIWQQVNRKPGLLRGLLNVMQPELNVEQGDCCHSQACENEIRVSTFHGAAALSAHHSTSPPLSPPTPPPRPLGCTHSIPEDFSSAYQMIPAALSALATSCQLQIMPGMLTTRSRCSKFSDTLPKQDPRSVSTGRPRLSPRRWIAIRGRVRSSSQSVRLCRLYSLAGNKGHCTDPWWQRERRRD